MWFYSGSPATGMSGTTWLRTVEVLREFGVCKVSIILSRIQRSSLPKNRYLSAKKTDLRPWTMGQARELVVNRYDSEVVGQPALQVHSRIAEGTSF